MPGFFPRGARILFIGQNPGQLHKRDSGWDDSKYAFNSRNWHRFQQDYAKGLMESPIGKWINHGAPLGIPWALTNIVKCRTPDNQITFEEMNNCNDWTEKQLSTLDIDAVVTLGSAAYSFFPIKEKKFSRMLYNLRYIESDFFDGLFLPMYHPAYIKYEHTTESLVALGKLELALKNKKVYTSIKLHNRIVAYH